MILCPNPSCDAVLRRVPGLHQPGEPYMQADDNGCFMVCLKWWRPSWQDDDDQLGDLDVGVAPA